jgi:hypothetical protein
MNPKKRKPVDQYVKRPIAMVRSPAFQVMSLTGHRILACVESEHCRHGGKDNGKLPVPHRCFQRFGIHHHAIGPGIREVVALGFHRITQHGVAGNGEFRKSTVLRITYLPAYGKDPTNEWADITTVKEAETVAAKARAAIPERYKSQNSASAGKRENQCRKPAVVNADYQCRKPAVNTPDYQCRKPAVLSRYLSNIEGCAAAAGPVTDAPSRPAAEPRRQAGDAGSSPAPVTKKPWAATHLIEITDPEELCRIRGDDEALQYV